MGSFSPLFSRKQPGGMFGIQDTALTVGSIWYVNGAHSNKGTGTGNGYNPDSPFTSCATFSDSQTNQAAGDIVFIAAGHTESIAAAAGWDCDTAGIKFKGLGWGSLRPTITFTTADTADIDIDAANVWFENLLFVANFLDIAAAIDVNADDFTMFGCECRDTSTVLNSKIWVLGATSTTSDRMHVLGCKFTAYGDANTSCVSTPGTPDGCKVNDNVLMGDWGTAAILSAGVITNAEICRNYIRNLDAGDDVCINVADNSTGICAYNAVGALETDNSTDQITVGTKMVAIQNYSVDVGDRQGILDPAGT